MAVFFDDANNPTVWRLTDSVVIVAIPQPPPASVGPGDGLVGMVGAFPWGPTDTLIQVKTPDDLLQLFGEATDLDDYTGYQALTGKAWPAGGLYVVRFEGAGAAKASRTIAGSTPEDIFKAEAKYPGDAGNQITMKYILVNATTFTLELAWGGLTKKYENLTKATTAFDAIDDDWLNFTWLDADLSEALPASDASPVALLTGSNGIPVDADYLAALTVLRQMPDGGIIFFSGYTSPTAIGYLSTHCAAKGCAATAQADPSDVLATNIAAAILISDESVRLHLHRVSQDFDGTLKNVDLAPFYASVFAAISPSESCAQMRWADLYLRQIKGVVGDALLERGNWIAADQAGGIMMERLTSGLFKIHMDITSDVTPGATSSVRARMENYIGRVLGTAHEPFLNTKPTPTILRQQKTNVQNFFKALQDAEEIEDFSNVLAARDGSSTTWITKVKLYGEQRYIINKVQVGENVVIETT